MSPAVSFLPPGIGEMLALGLKGRTSGWTRHRRPLRIILIASLVVIAALAAIVLGAPLLLNIPSIESQLQQELSHATNGHITWDALHVRLLPSPRAELSDVKVVVPGRVSIDVPEAEAHMRLATLLRGRVEIASVKLLRPVVDLELVPSTSTSAQPSADPIVRYRQAMTPVVDHIRSRAPESLVVIEAASVNVHGPDIPPLQLRELAARVRTDAGGADFDVTTSSNTWSKLRLTARIEFADLSARGEMQLAQIEPQAWLDRLLGDSALRIGIQRPNLNARIRTDAKSSIQGDLHLSAAAAQLAYKQRVLQIDGIEATAVAAATPSGSRIELTAVRLGSVLPSGRATLKMDQDNRNPELGIDIPKLDLSALRDAVLPLLGNDAAVDKYATRIRAGALTDVKLRSRSQTWSALFSPRHLSVALTIADGVLLLPVIEQEATALSGQLEFAGEAVQLRDAVARLGSSSLNRASARYSLKDGSVSADSGFEVQLAEALKLAPKMLSETRGAQLRDVTSAGGRLRGHAHIAVAGRNWQTNVEIAQSDAFIKLRQLPWTLALHAVQASASPDHIGLRALHASAGKSTLTDATMQLALRPGPTLVSASAQAKVELSEVYPWLRSQQTLAEPLRDLTSVSGTALMSLHRASGRLDQPARLQYDVTIQPQRVDIAHAMLPTSLSVASGAARLNPLSLQLDRIVVAMLDARAAVSGTISRYREKEPRVQASIADGSSGPQAVQWIWNRAQILERLEPSTPLQFTAQRIVWGPGKNLEAQAALQLDSGQTVDIELAWKPDVLNVRRVAIKDRLTDAVLGLTLEDALLQASFVGTLSGDTVAAMFKQSGARHGIATGDLRFALDLERRGRSTAFGNLSARGVDLSWLLGKPVRIDGLKAEADGTVLRIREGAVSWAKQTAFISGEVRRGPTTAIVRAQLDSPGIVLEELLSPSTTESAAAAPSNGEPTSPQRKQLIESVWPLPFSGEIKVRADFIAGRRYRVAPVSATLTLHEEHAQVDLHEAQLCGMSFPMTAQIMPDRWVASVRIRAHRQQLQESARCLTDAHLLLTGTFDLNADLVASRRPGQLARELTGTLQAQARDGKIMKFALLGNLLALKSVSSLFTRGGPRLGGEGFDYRTLTVKGHLDAGRLIVEEGVLDSNALGIAATGFIAPPGEESALTVLLAPFSRVDRLVRKIPIVGYVVGGTLTSVPVGVSGDIRDPRVAPLQHRALTSELTGIFTRTLKLPGRLLAPSNAGPDAKPESAKPPGVIPQ